MTTSVLREPLTGPGAWRAGTLDAPASWYYPLPDRAWAALDEALAPLRRQVLPVTGLVASAELRAACAPALRPARDALENGRGFAVIDRVPLDRYSDDEARAIYWLLGQVLGTPFAQNVQGTLLYDVRDTGQNVQYGARFSVTNAESSFHTDNSFGSEVLDYVGLLCLRTALSGGLSQMVSGLSVHNALCQQHSEALEVLYRPFHIDRRGGVRPGEGPTTQAPVFQRHGRGLLIRYLRYWIHAGHDRAGAPLTAGQQAALDALDRVAADPALRAEFALEPGQMYFINNRWILHNRTAFEDHAEPERRRHLVRLWLRGAEG
jgi:alpha-ketoglutarate-dependent taurine dioxygenase